MEYNAVMQAVMQAVSTLGFPIVMCAALFWKLNKSDQQHKEETDRLSEALNNNTAVMQRLVEKLGGVDDE